MEKETRDYAALLGLEIPEELAEMTANSLNYFAGTDQPELFAETLRGAAKAVADEKERRQKEADFLSKLSDRNARSLQGQEAAAEVARFRRRTI